MASVAEMERLVGKAMFEPEFSDYILDDPEAAAGSLDIKLEAEQLEAIRMLDAESMHAIALLFYKEAHPVPRSDVNFPFWYAARRIKNPELPFE